MINYLTFIFKRSWIIFFLLLVWEIITRLEWVDNFILPPFSVVIAALFKLVYTGTLMPHVWASFQRILGGFILAVIVGIPFGVAMGWFLRFERTLDPLIQLLRNTSVLAMFPIFILIFGLGEESKIAIIFWGALWPILINTTEGVKNIDPLLVKAARSMGVQGFRLFYKVILPAITPALITGARLSTGMSIVILVAAEMVGANRGLGFYIFYEQQKYESPQMYAGIIVVSLLGFTVNRVLVSLENSLTIWKEQKNDDNNKI